MVVGLLGGIGSGKSAVASLLAEAGAEVVDADVLAHRVLRAPEARSRVVARFGAAILGPDGEVDRKRLGAVVFRDRQALEDLNAIVHPPVREEILSRIRTHRAAGGRARGAAALLVLDVPLLSESPLGKECDALVFVEVDPEVRRERLRARGWESGELERREACQTPIDDKRRMAGHRIDNSGPLEATRAAVAELVRSVLVEKKREMNEKS